LDKKVVGVFVPFFAPLRDLAQVVIAWQGLSGQFTQNPVSVAR
jgi:hypothetical protein